MSHKTALDKQTKLAAHDVASRKGGTPLVMLALYDAQMARIAESAGIDLLLVGDSLGMAVQGMESTAQVTLDQIIYHAKAVRQGAPNTHIVGDLPFMTYQVSNEQAVTTAGRLVAEARVDSIKLEGGATMADRIAAISRAGIPVMAHVGLLPQTAAVQGGFKVQGRNPEGARQLLRDITAVTHAGAFAVVIELVGAQLAAAMTRQTHLPTIGIGAGSECDGQVLVAPDMLGMDHRFRPRFLKTYADLDNVILSAFETFAAEVRTRNYPDAAHSFKSPAEVLAAISDEIPGP